MLTSNKEVNMKHTFETATFLNIKILIFKRLNNYPSCSKIGRHFRQIEWDFPNYFWPFSQTQIEYLTVWVLNIYFLIEKISDVKNK